MLIQPINNCNNQRFGNISNFKIDPKSVKSIEGDLGITMEELMRTPFDSIPVKKPPKWKVWFANMYKAFGEKFGLLDKHYNIYTDID